jgi:transcriptional regulator with PAS, ATPase and Fis domain
MERVKAQEEDEEQSYQNWSETVEDLVTAGDTEGAITLLENEVSRLGTLNPSEAANLQLVSALTELAKLYSSKHFSLKSDELLFRASFIKQRSSGYSLCFFFKRLFG